MAYISELCVFVCVLEHSSVRWLHYVSRLWPQAAAGPEACGGRQTQNERGAQRRQNKGLISLLSQNFSPHALIQHLLHCVLDSSSVLKPSKLPTEAAF